MTAGRVYLIYHTDVHDINLVFAAARIQLAPLLVQANGSVPTPEDIAFKVAESRIISRMGIPTLYKFIMCDIVAPLDVADNFVVVYGVETVNMLHHHLGLLRIRGKGVVQYEEDPGKLEVEQRLPLGMSGIRLAIIESMQDAARHSVGEAEIVSNPTYCAYCDAVKIVRGVK